MLLIDAHVHIYDCFDLEKFFDSAYANFKSAAEQQDHGSDFKGVLLLAETSKDNWFNHLAEYADGKDLPDGKDTGNWVFHHTNENNSLLAETEDSKNLLLIAGRQIVTSEGLEILALSTTESFKDGTPIKKLIEDIKNKDGIPVIPWGFGKWLGRRGKILSDLMNDAGQENIFLGDNSGRPKVMAKPFHFKLAKEKGIQILPGSDPLPFKNEHNRAGSFGFSFFESILFDHLAYSLKNMLHRSGIRVYAYGNLENPLRFFRNQIAMQIRKQGIL